jgi:hypothetical protein
MKLIISLKRNQKFQAPFCLLDFIMRPIEVDFPWLKAIYFLLGMMVKLSESPVILCAAVAHYVNTSNKKIATWSNAWSR